MKSKTPDEEPESKRIRRAKYPFDFSTLREGDDDPILGKRVDWLVDSDRGFIVYIDSEGYVEWTMNSNNMIGPDAGPFLNMVGKLEAVDTSHLHEEQKKSYRRMIAEGVARLFQKNLLAAQEAFDLADKWITARNTEIARRWYLAGAGAVALVSAAAVCILGYYFDSLRHRFGVDGYNILMGTAAGGLGAWLSIIQRSRGTELDVAAGRLLHHLEGAFRIMAGTLGSFLVALAIHSGLFTGVKDNLTTIIVICMVAGISERLVPSLVEQIESRTVIRSGRERTVRNSRGAAEQGGDAPPDNPEHSRPAGRKPRKKRSK